MSRPLALIVFASLALVFAPKRASAGYTHYWTWKVVPPRARLDACLADMDKVVEKKRSILADVEGHVGDAAKFRGDAPFGDSGVLPRLAFNGVGDDSHETFSFPLAAFAGQPSFSFVKTNWKPYDVAAVACLIVAREHFPPEELEIKSDGAWGQEWTDGAKLYREVFSREAKNPLEPRAPAWVPSGEPSVGDNPFPITKAPSLVVPATSNEDELAKKRRIGWIALAAAAVVAMFLFGTQTQSS